MTKIKINLGCGTDYRKEFINVDNNKHDKADLKWDLNKYPYPFEDNSVDFILCKGVLENLNEFVKTMEEIHRILKPKGKLRFRTAMAYTYVDAKDPTHKQHFIPSTFKIFLEGFNSQTLTKARFNGKIWITIPFSHKLRFPNQLYILNSFINNIFTGIEGEFIKI